MTPIERLAIEQAIYNAIGADLKTGVTHNLRGDVNAYYLDQYEHTGATGFEVRVNGRKVGTYGFAKVKAQPAKTVTEVVVTDMDSLRAYDDPDFDSYCARWVLAHIDDVARDYFAETGVLCDGMEVVERHVPEVPEGIKAGGTLRLKPEFVQQARAALEGGPIAGLLGQGNG